MASRAKPAVIKARITHLEMGSMPSHRVPIPIGPRLALMQVRNMPLAFYRYLYEQVGRPHHWSLRRTLGDEALAAAIHAPTTEIAVLYVDGSPAGKRLSWGCVVVPRDFYQGVVAQVLGRTRSVVYVLPETRPLGAFFRALGAS